MGTQRLPPLFPHVEERRGAGAKLAARMRSTCTANWMYPLEPDVEYASGSGPTRSYDDIHYAASQGRHGDLPLADSGNSYSAKGGSQGSY